MKVRHDWTREELQALHALPLLELISKAHLIHTEYHQPGEIQVCTIISIKTGGCSEDCRYCAQSSRYRTTVSAQPLMSYEQVLADAQRAKGRGASRVCLAAAWREVRDSPQFEQVLRMTRGIAELGLEVCCCLGMLKEHQAKRLKEAGAYAYNHNLDTSERYYPQVSTSRSYQDRLDTLEEVEKAQISVCCGGIIGMGEEPQDRLDLLLTLAQRDTHPGSVPINRLSAIPGTPFADLPKLSGWEVIRMAALARILMPKAMVRLSAGRIEMSFEEQALCFIAGANSIHAGEKLLTVANTPVDRDEEMFQLLGLKKQPAYAKASA